MTYKIIAPPQIKKFNEMSKKEIREYYRWFMEQIPIRIELLCSAIRETRDFEGWVADFSEASLKPLGEWFEMHTEIQPRTKEEMEKIKKNMNFPFDIEDWDLTNETISIAFDIGVYFAETIRANNPSIKWDLIITGSKRYVDYGQPVLKGVGLDLLNPIQIMITFAYSLVRNNKTGHDLHGLYSIWIESLTRTSNNI